MKWKTPNNSHATYQVFGRSTFRGEAEIFLLRVTKILEVKMPIFHELFDMAKIFPFLCSIEVIHKAEFNENLSNTLK